jgi:uncharacterized protein (TIGR00730 family)
MQALAVYCGSSHGRDPAFTAAARAMGEAIARAGLTLVYGGGSVGLMGEVADAALATGGRVHGVITRALQEREVGHLGLTTLDVVETMHQRKERMADLSDGFIAMPGGLGTLEEIFEVWTWAQLGVHAKPLGFLNIAGYFDGLIGFLDQSVADGFVRPAHRAIAAVETVPEVMIERLKAYRPVDVVKWVEKAER